MQSAAAPQPGPLAAEIRTPERFSVAEFAQQRHIAALSRPLISSGTVRLSEDGFVWTQQEPYYVSLAFDGTSIVETSRVDDSEIRRIVRDPVTNNLTRTLFRMMTGSWQEMRASFSIHPLPPPSGAEWALEMKPRDEAVGNFIPRIVLSGTRYVDAIVVHEANGNTTRIELSNQESPE